MRINVLTTDDYKTQEDRCIKDLLYVYKSDFYINEKGYLTKLIDKLQELGYYKDNESLFLR